MNTNTGILKSDIVEINIICSNYHNYRISTDKIDIINNHEQNFRIVFKDGSIIDFLKRHILIIEYNTKEGMKK